LARTPLDFASGPVAGRALPRTINGSRDLGLLRPGAEGATVVRNAPNTTITVDRTDDPSGAALTAASACTAAGNDCSLRGALQFANLPQNDNTTISLPANTYILSINGTNAGGCDGNAVGDLGANRTMSLVGAGAATTVIRQTGTGPANDGDRVMCMNEVFTVGLIYNFSGLTFVGGREGTAAGGGAVLGGGGIIGGELNNSLTLTNVVMANNQETVAGSANLGGGALQITGGDLIITNSTIGGTNAPGAYTDRTSTNTGNAQAGSGGGVTFTPSSPQHTGGSGVLTVTGSTFSRNTASGIGGGGLDLLIFAFASPGGIGSGSGSIGTSTISNNQGLGTASGGGILVESLPTTLATSSLTSNSAGNRGGGIYVGGGSLLLNGTSPSITFTGNTATSGGSSVSTASAVSVDGTNTSIGGDIEISTLGSWTNNAGSTLAPTNVVVIGGTFNMNNSTMNVGGNLTVGPGAIVGSTFNGGTGTVNIAGNFVLNAGGAPATSLNAGTGTFNFNGSGAQSITNGTSITFFNLTDSNITQPLTLNNSLAVNGSLNVNGANAILAPVAAAVVSGTGTLTGTGTARATRIAATPDFLSQYAITNKTLTNLTIDYSGAGNQTINNTPPYSNLRVSGSGVKTLQGNTSITGNLNIAAATMASGNNNFSLGGNWTNSATFTPGTGTVTFAGTGGTQLLTGNTTFFNLTLNNTGATTNFGTTTTTVGNDLVATAGTMDGGTSTVIFTGTGDNAGAISGAAAKNFHTLQIDAPATISHSTGADITIENDYTNAGSFVQAAGLTTVFATDNNGNGAHNLSGGGTTTFGNVSIQAANTVDGGSHNFNVAGTSFAVAGTFNGNTDTVTFNGLAAQAITGDGAKNFSGLLVNNANGVTVANGALPVDAGVGGLLTLSTDLTVAPGAILQQSGTSAGAADVLGTVRRTDLGVTPRPFGNLNNAITVGSGTPPTQLDFNLVKAAPGTFPPAVKVVPRDITLTPTGGAGFAATVKLRYIDPAELSGPGITESRLALWKNVGGVLWTPQGGVPDSANDFVSLAGVTSFSEWAIAEASDLTLTKANNVGGSAVTGQAWTWTLHASNTGAPATFTAGQTILSDNLPSANLVYGPVTVQNVSNITGSANISCAIASNDLTCTANGGSVTFASNVGASGFDVVFSATPQAPGTYQNPRAGGSAQIDPVNAVVESNEGNNAPTTNTVTVGKANTTTAITSDSPDPSVVGQPVTVQWSVTVSAPGAVGPALSGNVTVSDGTDQCLAAVSAGQCDVTFTSPGAKSLTATYAGDTNYNGSASSPATAHAVNKADTTTTITSDAPDPSIPGQSVTVQWTATVNPPGAGTPTGNINVTASGGAETCSAAFSAGQCSLILNVTGARTLTAAYAGDANFNSSSDTESHQVCPASLVTTNADGGAGSLRQVVADVCDGAVITFDAAGVFSTPQTIALTTGEIVLDKNLTITAGASQIAVSGGGTSRVFHVNSGKTAALVGLSLVGGSSANGGAVLNDGALTLVNATLSGNVSTADGGAISSTATATTLTLVNTTISGNAAAGSGGGLAILGGTVSSINNTVTNNTADSNNDGNGTGGGLSVAAGTVTLANTIVAGNFNEDGATDAADDIGGAVDAASSFNLIGTGGAGGLTGGANGNQVGVANPGLGALAANGGARQTHALASTSPAVEAGSDANLPVDTFDVDGDANTAEALPVDTRGATYPRIADSSDADAVSSVDIGAFELHPSIEDIPDQTTAEDTPKIVVFNLGDDTGALIASVVATSSNTALVPSDGAHLGFTGAGGSRTLTITPNPDANSPADGGPTTITVTVTATNGRTASDTFALTVSEVNDPPGALADSLTAVDEDSGVRVIPFADLLGNDSAGPANESGQTLLVTLVGNPVGGTVQINGANVEFTPAADFSGPASFEYTVTDNGTTAGAPDPSSDTATASFTVNPINDPPTFLIAGNPPPVTENAGGQTVVSFATGISQGGGETGQVLTFTTTPTGSTGTLTFSTAPAIDASGTLTYTPSNGTSGTATFSVVLSDDGSNTPPNSNTSAAQSFTIVVLTGSGVSSAFAPASIPAGGTSTFTVTLSNPNDSDVTGVAFTNTWPAGVLVAPAPAAATTCPGGVVTPAGDDLSFSFAAGTIPANGSCTVSIAVTSTTPGVHTNTIAAGAVTSANAGANAAPSSATLTVLGAPTVTKAFVPTTITSGGTSDLTITLANGNGSDITGVAFTDVYPAGVSNAAAAPTTNTCGGTVTASLGGGQLQLANGTIPASGSCAITIPTTSAAPGLHSNTIAAGGVTSNNAPASALAASADLTVVAPPTATKSFSPASIDLTANSVLSIVISNPNPTPMDGVAFTDTYPAGFGNAASPAQSSSCGGTVGVPAGGLTFSGGTIAANGACTVTVTVTGTAIGNHVNTIPAGGITSTNFPASLAAVSGTLSVGVLDPLVVNKSFSPVAIRPGETSLLTITLTNNDTDTATGIAFADVYPAGLTNATPANPATNCPGGIVSAADGGGSVSLGSASLGASAQCTVTVTVTATTLGDHVNTILAGAVTAANAASNPAPVAATLTVELLAAPTVAKSFTPATIPPGGTSTLTISLGNPNAAAIVDVGFTDNFPAGLQVAAAPDISTTCGGTVDAVAGGTSLIFSGGTIPANGSCEVSVSVVAASSGSFSNVIPSGGVTSANALASGAAAAGGLFVGAVVEIPMLSGLALLGLAVLLAAVAILVMRR
jgi:uncharacterized repeat protein (TIGR01451 family)